MMLENRWKEARAEAGRLLQYQAPRWALDTEINVSANLPSAMIVKLGLASQSLFDTLVKIDF